MKQVKCPKCGRNYYLDNNPVCPFCGDDNSDRSFKTHDIPKTIEELKQWYKDRNLPDENITRFFIGKNYTKPKAFGIYEENGEFIVYKNKANGQRAIRYQGPNEAFAVKELYVRLKEEILNQKKRNKTVKRSSEMSPKKVKAITITIILVSFLLPLVIAGISFGKYMYDKDREPKSDYYQDAQGNFYHMDNISWDVYNWYVLNTDTVEWELYASFNDKVFPENLDYTMITDYDVIEEETGLDYNEYSFYRSRVYIDNHHHAPFTNSYYRYKDQLYYYLNDDYGGYYNDGRNLSGWYIFNHDIDDWVYYSDFDNRSKFNDEFWYYYDDYRISDSDSVDYFRDYYGREYSYGEYDFEDTDYYLEYEDSHDDYNAYWEEYNETHSDDDSSWWSNDSDSDYDWGSSDSWDSGSTDWDSDW